MAIEIPLATDNGAMKCELCEKETKELVLDLETKKWVCKSCKKDED